MIFSLIGMSNCGKTFWSKKLASIGFQHLSCDDYIERKLGSVLKRLGYSGIHDVSRWLGQPYDERHPKNSRIYLEFEKESLRQFIRFARDYREKNVVIDTTGSVIYTGEKTLEDLKTYSKIIYLDTPKSVKEEMYKSYLENPKPVLWDRAFKKRKGESNISALKRCYPDFLNYRTEKYNEIAHVKLDYFLIRKQGFTIDDFLRLIRIGLDS